MARSHHINSFFETSNLNCNEIVPMSTNNKAVDDSDEQVINQRDGGQRRSDLTLPPRSYCPVKETPATRKVENTGCILRGGSGEATESMPDIIVSSLKNSRIEKSFQKRNGKSPRELGSNSDGEVESSSSSNEVRSGSSTDPAVVTATTGTMTNSSSEERGSGQGRKGHVVALHRIATSIARKAGDRVEDRSAQTSSKHDSIPHQRHLHHVRIRYPEHKPKADGCGLPILDDVRFFAERTEEATVTAHLPPPSSGTETNGSSSGSGGECTADRPDIYDSTSLLARHREPGFHTIRKTFHKISGTSSTSFKSHQKREAKSGPLVAQHFPSWHDSRKKPSSEVTYSQRKRRKLRQERGSDNDDSGGAGSSSGSGTEGGYAGSASSNENAKVGSCSSPSVSSDESITKRARVPGKSSVSGDPHRPMLSKKTAPSSFSSELADFSSGSSDSDAVAADFSIAGIQGESEQQSVSSSLNGDALYDDLEETRPANAALFRGQCNQVVVAREEPKMNQPLATIDSTLLHLRKRKRIEETRPQQLVSLDSSRPLIEGKPPILALGCDIMAHVLTFLDPPTILDVLTMPLSHCWRNVFTKQPELWRVLCLLEPFKAQVDDDEYYSSSESLDSYESSSDLDWKRELGKFRILYTSFVRCMRYLARIKDDAVNGRAPSVIEYGTTDIPNHSIEANLNFQRFLACARGVVSRGHDQQESKIGESDSDDGVVGQVAKAVPVGVADDGSSTCTPEKKRSDSSKRSSKRRRVRYGHSTLTQRLLGPSAAGDPGTNVELPWSCAIYSIVNWMVAFSNVEGIQTICLRVLPFLLEDEQQRITAQRAGLTDIVLRAMVIFPDSAALHTVAFHTIVLLARPLGGREGMLFHASMVNSAGIFYNAPGSNVGAGKSGIAILIDSMQRFRKDESLQAMSCWSLVNIALAPAQKEALVKLGGIEATTNAMLEHPYSAEVQFRALFALINLVIPSVSTSEGEAGADDEEESTEEEIMAEVVDNVVHLVVLAMKSFCSSEAILNRACLVLHNLSLTRKYHSALLWTPSCYQMLEWCMSNYTTDPVLQQSAAGTLHRLQMTLSEDETLRNRFASSLQAQQQLSLEQAHREAVILRDRQERNDS